MSGGRRHWNDEAQRWEERRHTAATAPVTPPPVRVTGAPAGPAAPTPPGGDRPDRRTVWPVVTGVAVAGAAVVLVLMLTLGGGDEKQHDQPAPAPTTSAARTPDPTGTASPGITDTPSPVPPEGYEALVDEEGFRIAVPQGWARSEKDSLYGMPVVDYRAADGRHRLRIFEVAEASPQASLELFLSDERFQPDGFEKLALENLNEGDFVGSRLEYVADSLDGEPDLGTYHVYDQRFVATNGHIYAITVYGLEDNGRDDELELLTRATAWFCPPGTECPAPSSHSPAV